MVQNNIFQQEAESIKAYFPKLAIGDKDGVSILSGIIEIFADDNELIDSYEIEIHPTEAYPYAFPRVYEIGRRLPHNLDWHVYPDGSFCLAVPVEEKFECSRGITLKYVLEKFVCGFLFSQTFRLKNGYFYKERSHGLLGRMQYYMEYLQTSSINNVVSALKIIAEGKEPKSNSKCFCGSNKKFHKCHQRLLRILSRIAKQNVLSDWEQLNQILSKK